MSLLRISCWNVNGIRSVLKKGNLVDYIHKYNPDIIALQETKKGRDDIPLDEHHDCFTPYHKIWNSAEKPGYSGTLVMSKMKPVAYSLDMGISDLFDSEGRVINVVYDRFQLVNVYTPNSKRKLERLDYRVEWDKFFRAYLMEKVKVNQKPMIFCGDLNVAHREIDLINPKSNKGKSGFTDQERHGINQLFMDGYTDTFRHLNGDKLGAFTYWSNFNKSREKNHGWRIDYICADETLLPYIERSEIHNEIMGSDHCPISIQLSNLDQ
eukprot:TRINITY_DN4978_c0_g1_i1.p1 TRINITY_DN4978_c0_g1~~TRINITY_DN4978_c0_g1_i1.p1  ORF type:complete len:267 (+),score=49.39 TRINITY_DN4978_c0_g1_i1:7-807(+)